MSIYYYIIYIVSTIFLFIFNILHFASNALKKAVDAFIISDMFLYDYHKINALLGLLENIHFTVIFYLQLFIDIIMIYLIY